MTINSADLLDSDGVPITDVPLKYLRPNAGREGPTDLYRWYDADGQLLYVGISGALASREAAHAKWSSWSAFAARSTTERYRRREIALRAERMAIEAEQSLFNRVHNDTPESRQRLVEYLIGKGRLDLLEPAVSRG